MGCWCETDGITQLPINGGDKCRVFFMALQDYGHEKDGGGFCYPNDVWYPRGLPIQGEYDDYGGLSNIVENTNSKVLIDGLKNDWVPYEAKNQWEKSVNSNDLNVYVIMEEAERDRARIYDGQSPTDRKRFEEKYAKMKDGIIEEEDRSPYPEDRPTHSFGIMFVHEEVYQAMLKYDPIDAHHTDEGYLYRKRSEILRDDMEDWYTSGLEHCKEQYMDSLFMLESHGGKHRSFSAYHADPPFCKGISYYYEFLHQKMKDGALYSDPEVQDVCQGLIDWQKFTWAMMESRRAWRPQAGKGSQNNDTGIHKILADTITTICAKEDRESAADQLEWYNGVDWKAKHNEEELAKRALKKEANAKESK